MQPHVIEPADFAKEAAALIRARAAEAIDARGLFRLALAGGETPRPVYAALADPALPLDWARVQITFGDERCVPPEDAASNFHMAQEALLSRVPLPPANVFRLRGEIDPEAAAGEYEAKLSAVASRMGEEIYRHDLLLLGMGEDGHTASLFPGSPALEESTRLVIPAIGPKPPPQRLTMTFPILNAAREVCFLAKRRGKEEVLEAVLNGENRYPAARVRPVEGRVTWLIG